MPFPITRQYLEIIQPDQVVISGEGATAMINSLIQKPAITLVELVNGGAVLNLNAISVAPDGKLIIKHAAFKEALEAKLNAISASDKEPSFFDTNCSCGK